LEHFMGRLVDTGLTDAPADGFTFSPLQSALAVSGTVRRRSVAPRKQQFGTLFAALGQRALNTLLLGRHLAAG
jgi:hypothetical protein